MVRKTLEQKAAEFITQLKERAYGPGPWDNEDEGDFGTWKDWESALVQFAKSVGAEDK